MNTNPLFAILVILFALSFLFVSDEADSLDIKGITQGIVKDVKKDFIRIQEDIDLNNKGVLIGIDSNTVYDNVQKWADLKPGDKVQIEYQKDHKKNVAITITKLEIENFSP